MWGTGVFMFMGGLMWDSDGINYLLKGFKSFLNACTGYLTLNCFKYINE